jgi:hypothetical protein
LCPNKPGRRSAAKLLGKDEARRIAVSIAKLRRVNPITRPVLTFCQKLSASGSVCSTAISREEKSNVTQNAHHTNGHCGTGPRLDCYGQAWRRSPQQCSRWQCLQRPWLRWQCLRWQCLRWRWLQWQWLWRRWRRRLHRRWARRHVTSAASADRFPSWSIEERALVLSCAIVFAGLRKLAVVRYVQA